MTNTQNTKTYSEVIADRTTVDELKARITVDTPSTLTCDPDYYIEMVAVRLLMGLIPEGTTSGVVAGSYRWDLKPVALNTSYGIMNDYEYTATHKRERLTIWSGAFASSYDGEAFTLPKGDGYMVHTYNGTRVRVECPTPRNDDNYQQIDAAISEALNAHFTALGFVQMGTSV